ncbi:hypothetical protein [Anaeromicrobium sediminis]|uniref:Uncharacterized protein n=1 Tax=Anaeromicrobium sediminis TaxID=1478221 RepID=A0A267MGM7_9FIRM|nr:hypothetical protein [Anaeromicrobium sediminis]PAB58729.1 hypothetical protein CCE28_13750 [Anaeromicrobium sediminis]
MDEKLLLEEILKELQKINANLIKISNQTGINGGENEDSGKTEGKTHKNSGGYSWESLMPYTDALAPYTKNKK